jgi:hypothetical protein
MHMDGGHLRARGARLALACLAIAALLLLLAAGAADAVRLNKVRPRRWTITNFTGACCSLPLAGDADVRS